MHEPGSFLALKGGGGGAWGVVTRLTLQTYALPRTFGGVGGLIGATTDAAFKSLIEKFFEFYAANLLNPHWGEQVKFSGDNTLELSMVVQDLDAAEAEATWRPFAAFVDAHAPELVIKRPIRSGVSDARHGWDREVHRNMIPDNRPGAASHHAWWDGDKDQVGVFLHGMESLWLSATLLEARQRPHLVEAVFKATRHKEVEFHFNKGLAGAPQDVRAKARDTATNPKVIDAFALVIIADGQAPAYPGIGHAPDIAKAKTDAAAIDAATAELAAIAPDGGSYVSESNFFNRDWQRAFWGDNYARLKAVKAKYDPDGLFTTHHGVGSETWSADGFTRL
jgi:FAD/FMN-containing dehydrogenase